MGAGSRKSGGPGQLPAPLGSYLDFQGCFGCASFPIEPGLSWRTGKTVPVPPGSPSPGPRPLLKA